MECECIASAFSYAASIARDLSVDEDDWGIAVEVSDDAGNPLCWFISGESVIDCAAFAFEGDGATGCFSGKALDAAHGRVDGEICEGGTFG